MTIELIEQLPNFLATFSTIAVAAIAAYSKHSFGKMAAQIQSLKEKNAEQQKTITAIKAEHREAMQRLEEENKSLRAKVADLYERLAAANSRGIF